MVWSNPPPTLCFHHRLTFPLPAFFCPALWLGMGPCSVAPFHRCMSIDIAHVLLSFLQNRLLHSRLSASQTLLATFVAPLSQCSLSRKWRSCDADIPTAGRVSSLCVCMYVHTHAHSLRILPLGVEQHVLLEESLIVCRNCTHFSLRLVPEMQAFFETHFLLLLGSLGSCPFLHSCL